MRRLKPVIERLMSKVEFDTNGGCWLWTGGISGHGYGVMTMTLPRRHYAKAHRVSYELSRGPIPDGLFACHKCDVPYCVNPDHIFLGDHKLNADDATKKGRYSSGLRHAHKIKNRILTESKVRAIRAEYRFGTKDYGVTALSKKYGVSVSAIYAIVSGRSWAWLEQGGFQ